GGGIFTKGADMGADLVGKVEAGIPEDDPRNPAVIADNVGDNVGDVAGLGADLLESYVESIIASLAIASVIVAAGGPGYVLAFPFVVAALGILASIVGIMYVKMFAKTNPQSALMMGTYISAGLSVVGIFFYAKFFGTEFTIAGTTYAWWGPLAACVLGIVSGSIIGFVSEYFTSADYKPVKMLAKRCETGAATAVVEGTAIGMQSTGVPVIVLAVSVILAYQWCGVYGVALAALGMLATTGMVVAVDAYGPIADNAGGIAEMAGLDPEVRKITDNLDAVGNTTAAMGKGFAIGSAAFAAIGLLSAFLLATEVAMAKAAGLAPGAEGVAHLNLSLNEPMILAGLLVGAMLPFLFSSMLFRAVGHCADMMILEVRRQFDTIPGLREGKEGVLPDSRTCVDIATKGALRGMMLPGAMAILCPVGIGLVLGPEALAGMLVGAIATGVMLGIQTANSGGALDNAKKYIEDGHHGGKNSDAHHAAVVGDTVGDPLKDTVGPSINILIKLMCVISLVLAPLFVG
ncbi:MAG: sodium-translocating pyrophosphatase, partial [Candidatus Hydrogenedentes bacterium]|nr:sodium-translocating pyrophosphatase [Candidatus Hydrogenedentota bacterium]